MSNNNGGNSNEGDSLPSSIRITDLSKLGDQFADNEVYICDNEPVGDDVRLVPYYDVKGERLTRGKLWQCPRCGIIKDTEMDNLQRPEIIVPKAQDNRFFIENIDIPQLYRSPHTRFDIDPADDDAIRAAGGYITHTRIEINGRTIRND